MLLNGIRTLFCVHSLIPRFECHICAMKTGTTTERQRVAPKHTTQIVDSSLTSATEDLRSILKSLVTLNMKGNMSSAVRQNKSEVVIESNLIPLRKHISSGLGLTKSAMFKIFSHSEKSDTHTQKKEFVYGNCV